MSPRRKLTYREKAKVLRDIGFNTKFGLRGSKSSPQSKAAITRTWGRVAKFVMRPNNFRYVEATRTGKEKFGSKATNVPRGFFVQIPANVPPGSFRAVYEDGRLDITVKDKKLKLDRRDTVIRLNPYWMARDPKKYVDEQLKKHKLFGAQDVHLMVNGYQGRDTYDIGAMSNYIAAKLIPSLRSPDEIEKRTKPLTYKQIHDIFHLRVVHR